MEHTPAAIRAMVIAGLGVDDIRVRTGWTYGQIAGAMAKGRSKSFGPWERLARKRAEAERHANNSRKALDIQAEPVKIERPEGALERPDRPNRIAV